MTSGLAEVTPQQPTGDDQDDLSSDEIAWEIAKARADLVATLGKALAALEVAERQLHRLTALGDIEYTTGREGRDTAHWTAAAARSTRAGLSIARDIAGTA